MEKKSRRAFLGLAAAGGAGALAAAGSHVVGMDSAPGKDKTAFRFQCVCGSSVVAEVPAEDGDEQRVKCACGKAWRLIWRKDHFSVKEG